MNNWLYDLVPLPWRDHPAFQPDLAKVAGLADFQAKEQQTAQVFPPRESWFRALELTPPEKTRIVIVGQDPYHGSGQAHGLAFSVNPGVRFPPSLRNILKEWQEDLSLPPPTNGSLEPWAKAGVLLLNSTLTVREGQPQSHAGKGWETIVSSALRVVCEGKTPTLFLLWGSPAKKLADPLLQPPHGALYSAHPSPLSAYRGFFGSRPFSTANEWLRQRGLPPVDWSLA